MGGPVTQGVESNVGQGIEEMGSFTFYHLFQSGHKETPVAS